MYNAIHFYALMRHAGDIPDGDIPPQLLIDFRGLVAEFDDMVVEDEEAAREEQDAIYEAIQERLAEAAEEP